MSGHRVARLAVYTHRWLGIALGGLFVTWFVSGIVMMYARMPALDPLERLARMPALAARSIRVAPGDAATASRLTLQTLEGRPVYQIVDGGRARYLFADTGDTAPPIDAEQALRIARAFAGGHINASYDAQLLDADQWTFDVRRQMPLHRIALDDPQGTRLYVAANGGAVVMKTTRAGRRWGFAGAVLHWLYFAPFRRAAGAWSQTVIWLASAGTVLCLVGIGWGLWRIAPIRGYRLKDRRQWSPYASWMRWHHYAGLLFGLTTLTWVFSGLLSMDPGNWSPGTVPTREQRERLAGGSPVPDNLTVDQVRRTIDAFAPDVPKEIEFIRFRGHAYASAASGIVAIDAVHLGVHDQLPPDQIVGAAAVVMPAVAIDGMQWMDQYDAYYYDRPGRSASAHRATANKPLPVLRVRYRDAQQTWLYFDPRHGVIARKEERASRLNRWLYHGLHSFDFPALYYRRPLWDIVVIVLSLGGLLLSISTISASFRRVRRVVR